MQNFLELKCLVDDVDALSMLLFSILYYLMKWIGDSDMKKNISLDAICFLRKTITDDSN